MHPDEFAKHLSNYKGQPGPLTYLVASIILFVVGLLIVKWMAKGTKIRVQISLSPKEWQEGLLNLNVKNLLKGAMPFVAIVAIHAGAVILAFNILGKAISFQLVFSVSCYFVGTFFLLCAVGTFGYILILPRLLPKLRREANAPEQKPKFKLWMWFVAPLPWVIIFKGLHSYFVLLSLYVKASVWFSVGMWFIGTLVTMFAGLGVVMWFDPMIFRDDTKVPPPSVADEKKSKNLGELN